MLLDVAASVSSQQRAGATRYFFMKLSACYPYIIPDGLHAVLHVSGSKNWVTNTKLMIQKLVKKGFPISAPTLIKLALYTFVKDDFNIFCSICFFLSHRNLEASVEQYVSSQPSSFISGPVLQNDERCSPTYGLSETCSTTLYILPGFTRGSEQNECQWSKLFHFPHRYWQTN